MTDFLGGVRMHRSYRANLSPHDAVNIPAAKRYATDSDYDPEEMFKKLQKEALAREELKTNRGSVNSIDSTSTTQPDSTSWDIRYCPSPTISPINESFPFNTPRSTPNSKIPLFKRVPQEVYDVILTQLRILHAERLGNGCPTCFMRDLVSLQRTNRAWDKAVRKRLYENIVIIGSDAQPQLKKYRAKFGSRLQLLRRTLRERRALANLVKELTVPDPGFSMVGPGGKANPDFEEYRGLVASLVMVCPNLERLNGFYPPYNHEFDRLTHALSTRRRLKERIWVISENQHVSYRSQIQLPPGLLDQLQVYQFLEFHRSWTELETLMLRSQGEGIIEEGLFLQLFPLLPRLQNLSISDFDVDDFTDRALVALPLLDSLRLENLPGLTDQGLSRWAARPAAQSLRALSIIKQDIRSLLSISKILASLPNLQKFTFVQANFPPDLPEELMVFQPVLASPSLTTLHWDVVCPASQSMDMLDATKTMHFKTVNSHLALSIIHGGFPSLLSLRAPLDTEPPGALQAVCRPTKDGQILSPADRFSIPLRSRVNGTRGPHALPTDHSLQSARIRAQSYIEATSKERKEFIKVVITDHSDYENLSMTSRSSSKVSTTSSYTYTSSDKDSEEKRTMEDDRLHQPNVVATLTRPPLKIHEFSLPSFVGRVHTSTLSISSRPPRFNLRPDLPGFDADGGVLGWANLLSTGVKNEGRDGSDERLPLTSEDSCTGSWNQAHPRGNAWWRHPERARKGPIVTAKMLF